MSDAAGQSRSLGGAVAARLALLFSIDLRSLAAFRIVVSAAMLLSLVGMLPDVEAFLTDAGILSRADVIARGAPGTISLYLANGSYPFALGLVLINIAAAVALLFGYRTRFASVLCWVLYASMDARNFLFLQGGDQLISCLVFWAMFLPLGAVFSVDAALDPDDRRSAPPHLSVATVGLLLQALYVYFFGALLKTGAEWIPQGTAVFMAMSLDTFATPLARWFREFHGATYALTYYVWFLEILAPVLLFFPDRGLRVRAATLALLGTMHVGFRLFLDIGHFWLASLASLTAYIPGWVWDRLGAWYWRPDQARIVLYYDRDCGFCRKTCLILREFFLPRAAAVLPAQSIPEIGAILERETSWVVVDGKGNRYLHWQALVFVLRQSILARPLAWLVALYGSIGLGKPTYDLIGRNRKRFGAVTSRLLVERPNTFRTSRPVSAFLVLVVAACFLLNLRNHVGEGWRSVVPPAVVMNTTRALGLSQYWALFAPFPRKSDFWPVVEGLSRDGRPVDVFAGRFEAPAYAKSSAPFPSHRWRKYLNRIADYPERGKLHYFERYTQQVCRDWNRRHAGDDGLLTVKVTLLRDRYMGVGAPRQLSEVPIGTWPCAEP